MTRITNCVVHSGWGSIKVTVDIATLPKDVKLDLLRRILNEMDVELPVDQEEKVEQWFDRN